MDFLQVESLKSPCHGCVNKNADKKNGTCQSCIKREMYADLVIGIPERNSDNDAIKIHQDGVSLYTKIASGLNISDIGLIDL